MLNLGQSFSSVQSGDSKVAIVIGEDQVDDLWTNTLTCIQIVKYMRFHNVSCYTGSIVKYQALIIIITKVVEQCYGA